MFFLKNYYVNTTAKTDILPITEDVKRAIRESGMMNGLINVFVPGSTAGVVILENDSKIHQEYLTWVEGQVPMGAGARPVRRSGSGRNEAHLRAALVGAHVSFPLQNGRAMLGAWQEVVLFDFEDRAGRREFSIQIMGDSGGEGA